MRARQVHLNGSQSPNAKSDGKPLQPDAEAPADGGKLIVLTAPLTETIDHAGYFIQMGMASMPIWLEGVLNRKYPNWREVEYNDDGSARYILQSPEFNLAFAFHERQVEIDRHAQRFQKLFVFCLPPGSPWVG